MNIKQRKIQIEPKTKLNYNIYNGDVKLFSIHNILHTTLPCCVCIISVFNVAFCTEHYLAVSVYLGFELRTTAIGVNCFLG